MPNILGHIKGTLLILLGFFMPVSVFLTDVLIGSLALVCLLEGNFSLKWQQLKKNKWVLSLFALMGLYLLGMLWGDYHGGATWMLEKLSILFLLPVLLTLDLSQKQLKRGLGAFFLSMFLSAVIAILVNYKLIPYLFKVFPFITKNWGLSAFMPYNYHNVYLAITLVISTYLLVQRPPKGLGKWLALLLGIIVMLFSLFTERGRAGQLAFLIMSALLTIYFFRKKPVWILAALLCCGGALKLTYEYNSIFQKRINKTVQELKQFDEANSRSSFAIRALLTKHSWQLIQEKPLLGHGTGSFVEQFASVSPQTAQLVSGHHKTPHNNYLFVWFELGLIGLIAFCAIFYFQLKAYYAMPFGIVRCLLPIMFLVIMLSDSYFHNHNSAVLYAFLSGILARYAV